MVYFKLMMEKYENVFGCLRIKVFEELGLEATFIKGELEVINYK